MWQRFTERSRRVILLGQEEAGKMNDGSVDTEHLLLGLLLEREGVGAQLLERAGVSEEKVREEIERERPSTMSAEAATESKLTPRGKRILELAAAEARLIQHKHIGTEHLLLALLREEEGLAAKILKKFELSLESTRSQVLVFPDLVPLVPTNRELPGQSIQGDFASISPKISAPWERFTDRGRRAVLLGQHKAGRQGSPEVGSEHLLFGLLCLAGGIAEETLREQGVTAEVVGKELGTEGNAATEPTRESALSTEARKVLERSAEEASRLGHLSIGTEHLVLAFLHEKESAAARLLAKFGVDADKLRHDLSMKALRRQNEKKRLAAESDELIAEFLRKKSADPNWPRSSSAGSGDTAPKHRLLAEELATAVLAAINEAKRMDCDFTSIEHFLLALLKKPPARLERLLTDCGLNLDEAKSRLMQDLQAAMGPAPLDTARAHFQAIAAEYEAAVKRADTETVEALRRELTVVLNVMDAINIEDPSADSPST